MGNCEKRQSFWPLAITWEKMVVLPSPFPFFRNLILGHGSAKSGQKWEGKQGSDFLISLFLAFFLGNGSKPRLKKRIFAFASFSRLSFFFSFFSRSSDFCVFQRGTKEKYSSTVTDRLENRNLPMKVAKIYLAACCHSFRYFSRLIWFSCSNLAIFRPFFKVADFGH